VLSMGPSVVTAEWGLGCLSAGMTVGWAKRLLAECCDAKC
jgi:hypothetical protein